MTVRLANLERENTDLKNRPPQVIYVQNDDDDDDGCQLI
jgi:hypothetical protein